MDFYSSIELCCPSGTDLGVIDDTFNETEPDTFEDTSDAYFIEDEHNIYTHYGNLGFQETFVQPSKSVAQKKHPKSNAKIGPVQPLQKDINEPYLIMPGLYLGAESHAKREYTLLRLGITHVLGIHDRVHPHFPTSFDYLLINIRDKEDIDILSHFSEAHSFIKKAHAANGVVFVHCWAGMSRSATIVISYLMQLENIGLHESLSRVRSIKPDVNPNRGFLYQMMQFEKQLGIKSNPKPSSSNQSKQPKFETKTTKKVKGRNKK